MIFEMIQEIILEIIYDIIFEIIVGICLKPINKDVKERKRIGGEEDDREQNFWNYF